MNAHSDSADRALSRVGTVVKERWRIDALIGIGETSAVYAATDAGETPVAIKILRPELARDLGVRERFVSDAYAVNTIGHFGAVYVLDDDVADDGAPFLVMELLDGETIEARWERKGREIDPGEVLAITDRVLDVLAAAHAQGLVHRGVKPENLFLTCEGDLKVLGFGLAVAGMGAEYKPNARAFLAPEQASSTHPEVDARTDVWAVGATMFTLLTGQFVHDGASDATMPVRSVSSCGKAFPRSIVALVDRALAFDPAHRWPDAHAMQDAVRGVLEVLAGQARSAPPPRISSAPPLAALASAFENAPHVTGSSPSSRGMPAPPPLPLRASAPKMRPGGAISAGFPVAAGSMGPSSGLSLAAPPVAQPIPSSGTIPSVHPSAIGPSLAGPSVTDFSMPTGDNVAALDAFITARVAEREAMIAEVARVKPIVTEIDARLGVARRKVALVQEQLASTRKEKSAEDERFRRQTQTRMEGLGEARRDFRRAMTALAHLALADTAVFGADFRTLRTEVTRTQGLADARARDVRLHEAAINAFDAKAVKLGVILTVITVILFLLVFFSPMIFRAIYPPDIGTLSPR